MGSKIETSSFRKGLKVLYDGTPYSIVDFQHVKPGKGNQFSRTRLKNLLTGSVLDVTFKSGEVLEDPEIEDRQMTFLYKEGGTFHFMDQKTYDQVELPQEAVGDAAKFILADMSCDIMFFRGRAINLAIPTHVEFKITYCEPGVKGDTATNVTKPATIETGSIIQVPLFIGEGDTVKVNTDSGEYLERTKIG